jgi:TatD DNase family protein
MLTETDHPYGDRAAPELHQPGNVLPVEHALGRLHGLEPTEVRRMMWRNFAHLVQDTGCARLLSRRIRSCLIVAAASEPK